MLERVNRQNAGLLVRTLTKNYRPMTAKTVDPARGIPMLISSMFGPTPFRDIFLVAGFELREMLRSNRAILFASLYMMVAAMGSYLFVQFLTSTQPAREPPPQRDNRPFFNRPATPSRPDPAAPIDPTKPTQGRLFRRGSPFYGLLSGAVDEQKAVDFMASQPAITLFHMLISLMVLPMVIMITASESISQEHQSRGVRFVALRTGRTEFVLGKILGQSPDDAAGGGRLHGHRRLEIG